MMTGGSGRNDVNMSSSMSDDELKSIVNGDPEQHSQDEKEVAFDILQSRHGLAGAQEFIMFGHDPSDPEGI